MERIPPSRKVRQETEALFQGWEAEGDLLDALPTVKVCVAYRVDGQTFSRPPSSITLLERCQPVYEEMPGWQQPTGHLRRFQDLPPHARAYVRRLEEISGCPAAIVSVGAAREQTIVVREAF